MDKSDQPHSKAMLAVATFFAASYFLIHLTINVYFNADNAPLIVTTYGPTSISLCTGLLIYSFGTFLSRNISRISICYPDGYADQFIIFVVALTIIQFTGHAEIVINDTKQWNEVIANNAWLSNIIKGLSILGFPLMVLSLKILEVYQRNIITSMENHLTITDKDKALVEIGGAITWFSLFVTVLIKIITTLDIYPSKTEEVHLAWKSGAYATGMAVEIFFTFYVIYKHEKGGRSQPK